MTAPDSNDTLQDPIGRLGPLPDRRTAERRVAVFMAFTSALYLWALLASTAGGSRLGRFAHTLWIGTSIASAWLAWLLAAVVSTVFVIHAMRAFPLIRLSLFAPSWLKLLAIPFAVLAGIMEELWFRRLLMDALADHGGGWALQLIASALAFGAVHAIWGVLARRWRVALSSMIATTALGGALAVVYLIGGRTLAPCVWSHAWINLLIEPWLLVAAMTGGHRRA